MFQPSRTNVFLSWTIIWKKQMPKANLPMSHQHLWNTNKKKVSTPVYEYMNEALLSRNRIKPRLIKHNAQGLFPLDFVKTSFLFKKFWKKLSGPFPRRCLSQFRIESWCSTIEREMSLICIKTHNSFPFEWLNTRTRFETEACSNSKMGFWGRALTRGETGERGSLWASLFSCSFFFPTFCTFSQSETSGNGY